MTYQEILKKSIELLEDLENRKVSFRQLQKLLTQFELGNGVGWGPIKNKWAENFDIDKHNLDKLRTQYDSLVDISNIFAKFSNKAVYIFNLDLAEVDAFSKILTNIVKDSNSIKDQILEYMPRSLPESEIKNIVQHGNLEPIFISQEVSADQLIIQAVTFNDLQTRVELTEDVRQDVNQDINQNFDTIIGYQSTYNQGSDLIILHKKYKKLLLFIDFNLPQSIAKCDLIAAEYIKLLKFHLPSYQFSTKRCTLSGKVVELYNDYAFDSRVVELNHQTSTNSSKKEKMSNNKDLRKEEFHEQGLAAVGFNSDLYYIKILYEIQKDYILELTVPGTLKNTNWDNRAILGGCTEMADIDILIDKLIFTII